MQMDSCLILLCLFVFVEQDAADVSLSCNQNEKVIESGHNLTIQCELNSSLHHKDKGCYAKLKLLVCECGGEQLDCSLETSPENGTIQYLSVEVHNVTITGTYTIFLDTTCGLNVKEKFNVTVIQANAGKIRVTPTESPGKKGYTAIVCVALALVAIIAVVIVGIRKHRRGRSTNAESQEASSTNLLPSP